MSYFVLDKDGNPVPEPDMRAFAQWVLENGRDIAKYEKGNLLVSTVFLGFDTNFDAHCSAPVLFETMIFSPDFPELQFRFNTRDKALARHEKIVAEVKKMSKAGKPFSTLGIRDWRAFHEWARDHLKHEVVLSEMFELIGFKSEMDAFVFKSSRWYWEK